MFVHDEKCYVIYSGTFYIKMKGLYDIWTKKKGKNINSSKVIWGETSASTCSKFMKETDRLNYGLRQKHKWNKWTGMPIRGKYFLKI